MDNVKKRFAWWTSDGPTVSNLQLTFWDLTIEHFQKPRENFCRYAPPEGSDESAEHDDYGSEEFVEDAAVVLVLAGTSVAILLGQNIGSGRVPPPKDCLKRVLGATKQEWDDLIDRYDALRHFGECKHEKVKDIDQDIVQRDLQAAQEIWVKVLEKKGRQIGERFRNDFAFN